jgi:RimK family alpha-L-glutamate ligase
MKGCIILNAYAQPKQSVEQAERLKKEFNFLNTKVDILLNGAFKTAMVNGKIETEIKKYDFAIFLDKDKYLSALLEKAGVKLYNSHDSIRVCDDKAETIIKLSSFSVPIPDTIFGPLSYLDTNPVLASFLTSVEQTFGFPVVVKECYGSMGKGVYIAYNRTEFEEIIEKVKQKPFICQKYIDYKKGTDVRVIVIGNKAVSSILRTNKKDFRSNVGAGGIGQKFDPPKSFLRLAEKVAKVLRLDYCGVDLLFESQTSALVCEVNSNAFFEETERVTGKNIARLYAEYIINDCSK